MLNKTLFVIIAALLAFTGCKSKIKTETLYGDWKYVKIDKPKSDDLSDTTSTADIVANDPCITLTRKNELFIHWGGKIISHGTFTLNGDNIDYTELLTDNTKRTFPFYVSKLDGENVVFETLGKEGSRVKAVKR